MEYYSVITQNEILPYATTWVNLELIMLNEDRERQILYVFTYMWALKIKAKE